ncbi:MAG: anthranilate phosphoribosyltransferase [Candidatus Aureabacteria bacterium]|nr:anthranilate phosphoribosyltransferase [Candidatus Auribacterota bacterium]
MDIKEAIKKVIVREDLSIEEAEQVMGQIMSGNTTPAQIAAYLIALRMKGETVEEITGGALAMRKAATVVKAGDNVVDTCGTGGDGAHTFNISTVSAFVTAGAGVPVAKHGNRAVSSKCGSADVLAGLGVNINIDEVQMSNCIKDVGMGFLFAPTLHPAMKHAIGPRKEMGVRTIFNVLGPLTNPAGARNQVIGVFDKNLTVKIAGVLKNLGSGRAFVVHGLDGIDEITITGNTYISELKDGEVSNYEFNPEEFGIKKGSIDDIKGGYVEENVKTAFSILKGERSARRDIVILNAAAAIICGAAARDFKEGITAAENSIDSGAALKKLNRLIEYTRMKQ